MTTVPQTTTSNVQPVSRPQQAGMSKRSRDRFAALIVTGLVLMMLFFWLVPLAYMFLTSVKTLEQMQNGQIIPQSPATFEYEGQEREIFAVPMPDGTTRNLGMYKPGRESSQFIDPANPEAGIIEWEGRWRTLTPAYEVDFQWQNYREAFTAVEFPRLLRNTLAIAIFGIIGTVLSCILVAYGFSRFPIPYKNVLFLILISTIILPRQVTLIPTYAIFARLGLSLIHI